MQTTADMSARQQFHNRLQAEDSAASSAPSSPEPPADDDENFFASHKNDSQSSFGTVVLSRQGSMESTRTQRVAKNAAERLPNELVIAIMAKLSSSSDMFNCMLVNKQWAGCTVGMIWHRPLFTDVPRLTKISRAVEDPHAYFRYPTLVKRLNLSNLASEVSDGTLEPFHQCKKVERLTLTNCSSVTDRAIAGMIEHNSSLLALDITGMVEITDYTIRTLSKYCKKLQGLNITECAKVTDESIRLLAQGCRHLKRLKLKAVKLVTDEPILEIADACPQLLEVDLQNCPDITDASVIKLLSSSRSLRELRLAYCTQVSDGAFTSLPKGLALDSLRIIDLTGCAELTDAAVETIIEAAPKLRIMVLAKCTALSDRSVHAICKLGKNLHDIHLGRCNLITDDALKKLVQHCNRIRYIDLAGCNLITDDSVRHLADLPKLRRIGLVKCNQVTDESIQALVSRSNAQSSNPHNLERVHLSYCTQISINGVYALLKACPKLTHLSLTGIPEFHQREDLTQFCREAPDDFTIEQRSVFCVFSGDGVIKLRSHLRSEFARAEMAREQAEQADALGPGNVHAPARDVSMFDDAEEDDDAMAGMLQSTQLDEDFDD